MPHSLRIFEFLMLEFIVSTNQSLSRISSIHHRFCAPIKLSSTLNFQILFSAGLASALLAQPQPHLVLPACYGGWSRLLYAILACLITICANLY